MGVRNLIIKSNRNVLLKERARKKKAVLKAAEFEAQLSQTGSSGGSSARRAISCRQ